MCNEVVEHKYDRLLISFYALYIVNKALNYCPRQGYNA